MTIFKRPLILTCFMVFSQCSFNIANANTTQNVNRSSSPPNDNATWNLKNVDIQTVIDAIAKRTGKNFVLSPQVNGKVSFISNHPLSDLEVYHAFLALLQSSGYEAIEDGGVVKIISEAYAKEEGATTQKISPSSGNRMSVTVIRVKYAPAPALVKSLKQLAFHLGYMEAYLPTNDIIIVDRARNITRLVSLIRKLDKASSTRVDIIPLKHAQSTDLLNTISALLQQKGEGSGLTLAADERSNAILLRGGTQEQHLQVRQLLSHLDVPLNKKNMKTEVVYLKYLRAEKAAIVINSLVENYIRQKREHSLVVAQPKYQSEPQNQPVNAANLITQAAGSAPTSNVGTNTTADFTAMAQKQPNSGSLSPYVQWEESTNSLVISGPTDLIIKLKSILSKLDIRRPQVLIEAVIAEVEADRANELGVEINTGGQVQLLTRFNSTLPVSGIGTNNQIAISNPPTLNATGQGLTGAFLSGNNIRFLIRALQNDSRSNILSTPNIVTLDNEPAQIKVGQKISFSVGQIVNNPTGGNPFNFFSEQDVGLILTINPQITPDGSIKLIIQQELSNVLPGQVSAGNNPNLSERFIHTTVMAKNGDILVLGGLIQNEWQEISSKVPVLGDLPLFGVLFRSQQKQLIKQNLMIFLRPTILYENKETIHVVGSKYENLRQQQLETEQPSYVENNLSSPVLPILNKSATLPVPPILLS